jgi:hypothetical protein
MPARAMPPMCELTQLPNAAEQPAVYAVGIPTLHSNVWMVPKGKSQQLIGSPFVSEVLRGTSQSVELLTPQHLN